MIYLGNLWFALITKYVNNKILRQIEVYYIIFHLFVINSMLLCKKNLKTKMSRPNK